MRKLYVLVGLFVASLILMSSGRAQAAVKGIALSPAIKEVTMGEADAKVSFSLQLANTTDATVDLALSTLDFGALDESGGIAFLGRSGQETTSYGLKQWMVLEKDRLTLAPGQSQEVKVTIDNKEGLSPGGHYGAVVVSGGNPAGQESDNVAVLPAASTLVLLKKLGGESQKLELNEVKANSTWLSLPGSVALRFHNSGNTHVVPRGTIELFGPTGSKLARAVINPGSSYVLPESFRQFTDSFSFDNQPWLPGRYKIITSWRHDGQESFNQTVEYHWYMGKLLLGLLIIVSIVFVLILYIKYRKRPASRY